MVSNHPLVSIIIPNYNHARFLDERMTSVLEQTYQHIEVIILDDCSTDNSREVIEKYRSNPKVSKIVFNDTNSRSPFKQWYKGFQLC
jgi:glycosyltransferase involved in cell wall biosynthesis